MKTKTITTNIEIYNYEELSEDFRKLTDTAKAQTQKAYAPYSKFHVGSAVLLTNGLIVSGNNQENAAYPSGLCAERVAMFYANSQFPDTAVEAIAIAAYQNEKFTTEPVCPCSACLQVLIESETRFGKPIKLILYGQNNVHIINSIKECLPLYFHF